MLDFRSALHAGETSHVFALRILPGDPDLKYLFGSLRFLQEQRITV